LYDFDVFCFLAFFLLQTLEVFDSTERAEAVVAAFSPAVGFLGERNENKSHTTMSSSIRAIVLFIFCEFYPVSFI